MLQHFLCINLDIYIIDNERYVLSDEVARGGKEGEERAL
jgi:hypothetical protein